MLKELMFYRSRNYEVKSWLSSLSLMMVVNFCSGCALAQQEPDLNVQAGSFSRELVVEYARKLAQKPFVSNQLDPDDPLRRINYDEFRKIIFRPDASIWRNANSLFQIQLFHPGFLATTPVQINVVEDNQSQSWAFSPEVFVYPEDLNLGDLSGVPGYAGFRLHNPINSDHKFEEFLVFLGASYFRGVGKNQFYGLSARGLTIDTENDEEFPSFSEFWIERPLPDSKYIMVHALLNSPSVTGAFSLKVQPGSNTAIDVDAHLFPRKDLARVGLAPLTSMFLFDASNKNFFDDYRRAVHDSDGLLIHKKNGERVWRPLANPQTVQVSSFGEGNPIGFGLMQRHQNFWDFEDDEARYDKRPSLWIEPKGNWGDGSVVLVEIPSRLETNDNVVAYWQPMQGLSGHGNYHFNYRMTWGSGPPGENLPGRIVETATGEPSFGSSGNREREFVIDFSADSTLSNLDSDSIRIEASSSAGKITNVSGTLVQATGNYRVYLKLNAEGVDLAELRVALVVADQQWGETWLYRWTR